MKKILFLLIAFPLFADYSVVLFNDSPFELTAQVQAANGTIIGKTTLKPGEQNIWRSDLSRTYLNTPNTPKVSLTPFSVIWYCPYGGFYSMCSNVPPGATVTANTCPGSRYCQPKPKEQKCPPCICVPPTVRKKTE
ncbi:MAG: hypothetical protein JW769_03395 [Parachlamydiales bacterium]|nr:hypothetical protein [Parachlamydiales bacterium]